VPKGKTPLIALKYEAAPLPFVVSGAPASYIGSYIYRFISGVHFMFTNCDPHQSASATFSKTSICCQSADPIFPADQRLQADASRVRTPLKSVLLARCCCMALWLVADVWFDLGPMDVFTTSTYGVLLLIATICLEEVLFLVSEYPIQLLTINIQSHVVENGDF